MLQIIYYLTFMCYNIMMRDVISRAEELRIYWGGGTNNRKKTASFLSKNAKSALPGVELRMFDYSSDETDDSVTMPIVEAYDIETFAEWMIKQGTNENNKPRKQEVLIPPDGKSLTIMEKTLVHPEVLNVFRHTRASVSDIPPDQHPLMSLYSKGFGRIAIYPNVLRPVIDPAMATEIGNWALSTLER